MSQVFPLIHEFSISDADQAQLWLTHEFSIVDADQAKLYIAPEFGPTYIHRIRIKEITNLTISNKDVKDVRLKHIDEDGVLTGLARDVADDSFIVEQEFGFDPAGLRVDFTVSGDDPDGQAVFWPYKDQIPEVVWL